jgi:hypothetical protein
MTSFRKSNATLFGNDLIDPMRGRGVCWPAKGSRTWFLQNSKRGLLLAFAYTISSLALFAEHSRLAAW